MEVFPNPVENVLIIRGTSDHTQNVSWSIYSHGTYAIVLQGTLNIESGHVYTVLNVSHLKKGIYYVRFSGPASGQTFKLLKL
jgi:hypothetical protein